MSEPRRTLALCLACLVPGGLALLGACFVFVFWMTDPPVHTENWGEFSNAELAAVLACGVLAALGGSLLGVVTARWWRWPTAAAVTAVLLILWTILGLINDTNALLTLNHLAAPYTLVSSNGDDWSWHLGGSWLWRVAYLTGLCGLAVIAACAHGSDRRPAPQAGALGDRARCLHPGRVADRHVHRPGGLLQLGRPVTWTIRAELRAVHWSPVAGGLAAAAGLAALDLDSLARRPGLAAALARRRPARGVGGRRSRRSGRDPHRRDADAALAADDDPAAGRRPRR